MFSFAIDTVEVNAIAYLQSIAFDVLTLVRLAAEIASSV